MDNIDENKITIMTHEQEELRNKLVKKIKELDEARQREMEEYANQRVIEELESHLEESQVGNYYTRLMDRIKELKQ